MGNLIQVRRDTAANWTSVNPTLAQGEIGLETDTGFEKIGDGTTAWNSLAYLPRSDSDRANVKVKTLPVWAKKRALSQLNQSPMRILCVGDSTTAGIYSDVYGSATGSTNQGGPNSYPSQLAKRLTAMGLPADYGFALPGHSGNDDSRWTIGAGWSYVGKGNGMGNNSYIWGTAAGTMTLNPAYAADTYVIYYYADNGTGSFTVQATGGASTTITSKATAGIYTATITAASASASNVVTFTWVSGTAFVAGVEFVNSANGNRVRVLNGGVGGSTSADWATSGAAGSVAGIKAIAPDLTIISLGINDSWQTPAPAASTVMSNVQAVINAAAVSGDVMLMSAFPRNASSPMDGYNAAYLASGKPYVDIQRRWMYSAQSMGLMTSDNIHPNAVGYGDIATAVANALLSI